ncbi:hypothetical protein DACRYDRAFT_102753 [Dacryopinax primogenitus]|uniref:CxC2-like cysteine cluster KDZ transposase-associated domain-containing protein n=1 Tax=Dacryopinax primogenitus (strain DJM 731) TaxID=1858805 RepID=M5FQ07_DACPD|nr:uncharacterized protein DACRYDRAFT_102753 [Dacryopinax primogenitus]EJT96659.1 hypothetical protein DACRYDRAFT_102753 [Dacryopinax primogenitus]
MLLCGDGNNSSKWFEQAGHQDDRIFETDYVIPAARVELYARPPWLQGHDKFPGPTSGLKEAGKEAGGPGGVHEEPEPEQLADCASKWKAAQAKEDAGSFCQAFAETGHFLVVCRHAFILWSVDMIKSGELSRYSLTVLDKCIKTFGVGLAFGYDIGCTHSVTIQQSPLGAQAAAASLRFFVGAFHGYAHNRRCQLAFHPCLLATAGLEDFETCEWVFAKQNLTAQQNLTAHLFRHASRYHRHQTMHLFYQRWDRDCRTLLSNFLYNNYKQALDLIQRSYPVVQSMLSQLGLTTMDLARFLQEEWAFFDSLQEEPAEDQLAFCYLETLHLLHAERHKLDHMQYHEFVVVMPASWPATSDNTRQKMLERDYNRVLRAVHEYEALAARYELELQTEPWTPEHPSWQKYEAACVLREYHTALDELESLVVQHIFELEKLSIRGTGYAMRTAIACTLNTRSKAIKASIARYNKLALSLQPPRPTLKPAEVLDYALLADFSLLRHAREDIRQRPWANPRVRELIRKWQLVQCAEHELERLNIEIRRVNTQLHNEPARLLAGIPCAEAAGDRVLASVMRDYVARQLRINTRMQARMQEILQLPGFCG